VRRGRRGRGRARRRRPRVRRTARHGAVPRAGPPARARRRRARRRGRVRGRVSRAPSADVAARARDGRGESRALVRPSAAATSTRPSSSAPKRGRVPPETGGRPRRRFADPVAFAGLGPLHALLAPFDAHLSRGCRHALARASPAARALNDGGGALAYGAVFAGVAAAPAPRGGAAVDGAAARRALHGALAALARTAATRAATDHWSTGGPDRPSQCSSSVTSEVDSAEFRTGRRLSSSARSGRGRRARARRRRSTRSMSAQAATRASSACGANGTCGGDGGPWPGPGRSHDGATRGGKRVRHSQLQRLLSRPLSTRFG